MSDDRVRIADAMIRHGGSFAKALGRALRIADPRNVERIERTWPGTWKTYSWYAQDDAEHKEEGAHKC